MLSGLFSRSRKGFTTRKRACIGFSHYKKILRIEKMEVPPGRLSGKFWNLSLPPRRASSCRTLHFKSRQSKYQKKAGNAYEKAKKKKNHPLVAWAQCRRFKMKKETTSRKPIVLQNLRRPSVAY